MPKEIVDPSYIPPKEPEIIWPDVDTLDIAALRESKFKNVAGEIVESGTVGIYLCSMCGKDPGDQPFLDPGHLAWERDYLKRHHNICFDCEFKGR